MGPPPPLGLGDPLSEESHFLDYALVEHASQVMHMHQHLPSPPLQDRHTPPSTTAFISPTPTTTTTTSVSPPPVNNSPSQPQTSCFSTFSINLPGANTATSTTAASKRKAAAAELSAEDDEAAVTLKRQRNTLAARKYRQKRLDRISELEAALAAVTGERDDLRLQLARREAEADALRGMLAKK